MKKEKQEKPEKKKRQRSAMHELHAEFHKRAQRDFLVSFKEKYGPDSSLTAPGRDVQ